MNYKALIELIVRIVQALIKPLSGLFALLVARRHGRIEAENEALKEHADKVKAANTARIDAEREGLRDEDYRD